MLSLTLKWLTFFFAACLISLSFSCFKNYSKEGDEELPEVIKSMTQSQCGACPYYIQKVKLFSRTYYTIVSTEPAPGIVCDRFSGEIFIDNKGEVVDQKSDTYDKLIAMGVRSRVIFECP